MKILELLKLSSEKLKEAGVPDPLYDAKQLLMYCLNLDDTHLFMAYQDECESGLEAKYGDLIEKRAKRIPLQHILGYAYFYGRKFKVNSSVLVPRPDTEVLVENALEYLKDGDKLLDMCTGSACIVASLALERKLEKALGVDVSSEALEVASANALALGADVAFIESDLFENKEFESQLDEYDMIVSNPPYIRSEEIEKLEAEVREHDPMLALDGFEDGLYFYRKISREGKKYLKKGAYLIYEIGYDQADDLRAILKSEGYSDILVKKDYAGNDRVVIARK